VFCEAVQHGLRFCLHHLNCVKMAAFQFYLQSGKQRKIGWVRDDSHVAFGKKILYWKRKFETVCCRDATASSFVAKLCAKVFVHFHAVVVQCLSSMQNLLFGLPGPILCEQSPLCQRKLWACSWFCSSSVSPFTVSLSLDFQCMVPDTSLIIARVSMAPFWDLHKIWWCSFVGSSAKSHQARCTTPNKRTNKC
jgi:hypothetical protein